jgi:hypothetical protein
MAVVSSALWGYPFWEGQRWRKKAHMVILTVFQSVAVAVAVAVTVAAAVMRAVRERMRVMGDGRNKS